MNNETIVLNSFKTVVEMLHDRKRFAGEVGEDVYTAIKENTLSSEPFAVIVGDVCIVFYISPKLQVKTLMSALLAQARHGLLIVVLAEDMKQSNMDAVAKLELNINFFNVGELQVNVSRHSLVPLHEVLDPALVAEVIASYRLKNKQQLPLILKTDAQSRYLGLRSGDVIKVTRQMASPSYQNYAVDSNFLFSSTATDKPYYVDSLLYSYLVKETFDATANAVAFFTDVSIKGMQSDPSAAIKSCVSAGTSCQFTPSGTFTGDPATEDLRFQVSRATSLNATKLASIVAALLGLTVPPTTIMANTRSNTVGMSTFMGDVVNTVCMTFLHDVIGGIPTVQALFDSSHPLPTSISGALSEVSAIPASLSAVLINNMHDAAVATLTQISAKRQKSNTSITHTQMQEFCTSFDTLFFYELRTGMIAQMSLRGLFGQETDLNAIAYIKKILVDLYIKTCFPLIQYYYIVALTATYRKDGDFVNTRVGELAQVFFTYFAVYDVYKRYQASAVTELQTQSLSKLGTIINTLNAYIASNNNININSNNSSGAETTQGAISKILVNLHTMSSETDRSGSALTAKKSNIESYQLTLRNILVGLTMLRQKCVWPRAVFWMLFAGLLALLVACVVLLILHRYAIVMGTTAGVAGCILIFVFCRFVWNLLWAPN